MPLPNLNRRASPPTAITSNLMPKRRSLGLLACFFPLMLTAQERPIDRAAFLVGCWERSTATRRSVEKWFPARDGVMHGTSQVVTDSGTRELERLRLYQIGDTLVYEADPVGQALTLFRASEVSATRLVFENPDHDFPQRITYSLAGDSLHARIEGDRAGRRGPVTFRFRRSECPGVQLSPSAAPPG